MTKMFRKAIFTIFILISAASAWAQQDDFCSALDNVMTAAKTKFSVIKGAEISNNDFGTSWESKFLIPGNIRARIVSSMGLFYEGALFQTKDKDAIKDIYDHYLTLLDSCLSPKGYSLSKADNFYEGIEQYKKLVFINSNGTLDMPPPHVSMEVDFYKKTGIYTVVLYVWEH